MCVSVNIIFACYAYVCTSILIKKMRRRYISYKDAPYDEEYIHTHGFCKYQFM